MKRALVILALLFGLGLYLVQPKKAPKPEAPPPPSPLLTLEAPRDLDLAQATDREMLITVQLIMESHGKLDEGPFLSQMPSPKWLDLVEGGQAYLLRSAEAYSWLNRDDALADTLHIMGRHFPPGSVRSLYPTRIDSPAPKAFDSCWTLRGDDAELVAKAMPRLRVKLGSALWSGVNPDNPLESAALAKQLSRSDGLAHLVFSTGDAPVDTVASKFGLRANRCGRGGINHNGDLLRTFPGAGWSKPLPGDWLSRDSRFVLVAVAPGVDPERLSAATAMSGARIGPAGPLGAIGLTAATARFESLDWRHPNTVKGVSGPQRQWTFRFAEPLSDEQRQTIAGRLPESWRVLDPKKP